MEKKTVWCGQHRGVNYEIVNWELCGMPCWNYYLIIKVKQLSKKTAKIFALTPKEVGDYNFITHDYEDAPIVKDLDWHGGITWYSKEFDAFGKVCAFKLGCDYQHSFDKGQYYNLDILIHDAENSINKLWELVPNLKIRDNHDGKYFSPAKRQKAVKATQGIWENLPAKTDKDDF